MFYYVIKLIETIYQTTIKNASKIKCYFEVLLKSFKIPSKKAREIRYFVPLQALL